MKESVPKLRFLSLLLSGAVKDRSIFLEEIQTQVTKFAGHGTSLDVLICELAGQVHDAAGGHGHIDIEESGGYFTYIVEACVPQNGSQGGMPVRYVLARGSLLKISPQPQVPFP